MHLEGNVCTAGNKRPSNVHGRDCSSWARRHQSFKHQHMRAIAVPASNNVTCKQVTNSNQPICRTANSPRAVLQLTDMQASWTPDTRREHADREHDQTWETGNMQAGRLTRQARMQAHQTGMHAGREHDDSPCRMQHAEAHMHTHAKAHMRVQHAHKT
jgi:hypothetical protein